MKMWIVSWGFFDGIPYREPFHGVVTKFFVIRNGGVLEEYDRAWVKRWIKKSRYYSTGWGPPDISWFINHYNPREYQFVISTMFIHFSKATVHAIDWGPHLAI